MKVNAIRDNIIVEELDNSDEGHNNTIIIQTNINKFRRAIVTSVGEDVEDIKVGMQVSYDKDSVYRVELEDTETNEKKVIAVLKQPDVYAIIV